MVKHIQNNMPAVTKRQKIYGLVVRLAGDKLSKVEKSAEEFVAQGKSLERAWADALELLRCPNTFPDLDLN